MTTIRIFIWKFKGRVSWDQYNFATLSPHFVSNSGPHRFPIIQGFTFFMWDFKKGVSHKIDNWDRGYGIQAFFYISVHHSWIALRGMRTCDLWGVSKIPYQLSYRGACTGIPQAGPTQLSCYKVKFLSILRSYGFSFFCTSPCLSSSWKCEIVKSAHYCCVHEWLVQIRFVCDVGSSGYCVHEIF